MQTSEQSGAWGVLTLVRPSTLSLTTLSFVQWPSVTEKLPALGAPGLMEKGGISGGCCWGHFSMKETPGGPDPASSGHR